MSCGCVSDEHKPMTKEEKDAADKYDQYDIDHAVRTISMYLRRPKMKSIDWKSYVKLLMKK